MVMHSSAYAYYWVCIGTCVSRQHQRRAQRPATHALSQTGDCRAERITALRAHPHQSAYRGFCALEGGALPIFQQQPVRHHGKGLAFVNGHPALSAMFSKQQCCLCPSVITVEKPDFENQPRGCTSPMAMQDSSRQ